MKKTLLLTFIGIVLFSFSYGQAIIKGKVTDKKTGETLIGVTISLKSKPGVGVTTDLDGNFTFTLPDATVQTLVISYISYETKEEIIHPVMGETITKNFILQSVSQDLGTIEVKAKATRAKEYYMENIKKNSASSIDFISSDVMKKTGDVNVTAAVTRVSGVSMSSNGFISVRGISDRYVKTTINGSRIPTLDPFTNNIKLDLFPASLIDNVVLTKTASPDLPGDWAGAYISLETKDYPEKFAINMETSVGYNQQTTFKEVLTTQQSKTDWLGYDNGLREYDHNSFVPVAPNGGLTPTSTSMTLYEQLIGLGLLDYLNSMGVTANVMATNGAMKEKNPYFILGLVQLGLLDKELQTNDAAIHAALTKYTNGGYAEKAFQAYYKDGARSGQAFKNNWVPIKKRAPLNFSQSFSIGNQTKLFGRTLGVMAGFRYGSGIQYDPLSLNQTVISLEPDKQTGKIEIQKDSLFRSISKETHTWSALMNLYYKLNINNSVTLLFMPNYSGVNNVSSQDNFADPTDSSTQQSQFYEQRKQLVYQLKSEHLIPGPQIKLELNASYTNGKSNAPDYKQLSRGVGPASTSDVLARRFRYLTDNVFDSRISAEIPLKNSTDERSKKLKFGAAYQNTYRKSDQIEYQISSVGSGVEFKNNDLEAYLDVDNFGIHIKADGTMDIPMYYVSPSDPLDHAFGKSSVTAGFGMLDYSLFPFLRFAGGLRVEQATMYTDLVKFHAMGLESDDPRRSVISSGGYPQFIRPGKLNELSYLPSVNLIFKLKKDVSAPINLRINYSHTVVRPSIRELSDFALEDFEYRARVFGNPDLKMAKIKNYDIRFESYFKSGENVSASVFYKDFKDHIEMVNYTGFSWQNVDKSHVLGLELEGKKTIIKKYLVFRANLTFVKSQTIFVRNRIETGKDGKPFLVPDDTVKRAMVGQAPYVLNSMLVYTADSLGLTITLSYNIQGPKLAVSSITKYIPDVYELPRHLLDFKVTKKLGRHWSTSLTVRDILNSAIQRAYKFDTWDTKFDSYRYGTNYVLGISYQL